MTTFDQEIAARTAIGEARSEGQDAMVAVVWTGVNRFTTKRWYSGQSLAGTFLKKMQYDCWDWNDPSNYPLITNITDEVGLVLTALALADGVIKGMIPDPTLGATHYYDDSIDPPVWVQGATMTIKIGRLTFYKDVA